jgi:hypothetical protein
MKEVMIDMALQEAGGLTDKETKPAVTRNRTWKFKYGVIVEVLAELDLDVTVPVAKLLDEMKDKTLEEVLGSK